MKYISTDLAPAAIGPYSQAIEVNGFLFASGQVPLCPKTGVVVGTTIEEQAKQTCENVKGILTAAGLDFTDVVKTTCFLADIADFAAFNAVYAEYFVSKPARSCVAAKDLPRGVMCEIEILAVTKK
jgi:2-iminobutanoate/2-iminopropanoate deaminase